jgi:plastocyanin
VRRTVRAAIVALVAIAFAIPSTALAEPSIALGTTVERIKIPATGPVRFRPANLTVERGTRVRWVNKDGITHTTTSDLWNERLSPGEKFTRRFRRAGTFEYRCTIHPTMTGTITVT